VGDVARRDRLAHKRHKGAPLWRTQAFLRAHVSAIREWRRKTVLLGTIPVLEVRTEDHKELWVDLADTGNYETGVYAIY
jgi:hypothetical protein